MNNPYCSNTDCHALGHHCGSPEIEALETALRAAIITLELDAESLNFDAPEARANLMRGLRAALSPFEAFNTVEATNA